MTRRRGIPRRMGRGSRRRDKHDVSSRSSMQPDTPDPTIAPTIGTKGPRPARFAQFFPLDVGDRSDHPGDRSAGRGERVQSRMPWGPARGTAPLAEPAEWVAVCPVTDLTPAAGRRVARRPAGRGVPAGFPGGLTGSAGGRQHRSVRTGSGDVTRAGGQPRRGTHCRLALAQAGVLPGHRACHRTTTPTRCRCTRSGSAPVSWRSPDGWTPLDQPTGAHRSEGAALTGFTVGVTARARPRVPRHCCSAAAPRWCRPRRSGSSASSTTRNCGTPPESVIADPPDIVVATTGIGFRGWIRGRRRLGSGRRPRRRIAGTRLLARGPKAKGRSARPDCTNSGPARGVLLGTDQRTARRGCGRSAGGRPDARRHHRLGTAARPVRRCCARRVRPSSRYRSTAGSPPTTPRQ